MSKQQFLRDSWSFKFSSVVTDFRRLAISTVGLRLLKATKFTMFCLVLGLSCFSQAPQGVFTPGFITLVEARSPVCGLNNIYTFKARIPGLVSPSGATTYGQATLEFSFYQNGIRRSTTYYPQYGYFTPDSTFSIIFNSAAFLNISTVAGYDFSYKTTIVFPGFQNVTESFGNAEEGVVPGLNNDHYFGCNSFFSKAAGDLHYLSTWGKNADGSGEKPSDFSQSNQFTLANRPQKYMMTGDWSIGTLKIPTNSELQINGFTLTTFTLDMSPPSGTVSGSPTSNWTVNGTGPIVMTTGAGELNNFTVTSASPGAYVPVPMSVYGVLTISSAGFQTVVPQNLVLKSTATRTARVAPFSGPPVPNSGGYIGPLTVERYIPPRRAWRLICAPLTSSQTIQSINGAWQEAATTSSANPNPKPGFGTHITEGPASAGFDHNPLTAMTSIKRYNSATDTWNPIANTNTTPVASGAYLLFVRGDRSIPLGTNDATATGTILRSAGYLNLGDQTFPVEKDGFTAVPNPFASPINFATITRTNVQNNFYVWDPKMGSVGGYVLISFNGSSYDVIPASVSPESQYIQSGQAFLVHSTGGNPGSITIKESDKASTPSTDVFRTAIVPDSAGSPFDVKISSNTPGLRISLHELGKDHQSSLLDEVFSAFNNKFSDKIDEFDAEKMDNVEENIAIVREGKNLMMERRTALDKDDIIRLKTWNMQADKQYQLEFHPVTSDTKISTAYLLDNFFKTNTPIDLTRTSYVQFSANSDVASSTSNRFSLTFKASSDLIATKSGNFCISESISGQNNSTDI